MLKKFVFSAALAAVSLGGLNAASAGCCPCHCHHSTSKAPAASSTPVATAAKPSTGARVTRRYSYEPGQASAPARVHSGTNRGSRSPGYLLPKTDSRRFGH